MANFQRIGLMARLTYPEVADSLRHLARYLAASHTVVVEEQTARLLNSDNLSYQVSDCVTFASCIDLAIIVGGDGSMLSAARDLVESGVPLLGVNRGRLGFLTDIHPDEIEERVGKVLAGDFVPQWQGHWQWRRPQ